MATQTKIPLTPGAVETAILKLIDNLNDFDQLPALLDIYIERSGIEEERFTEAVRYEMIDYLMDRGVDFSSKKALADLKNGEYDEHFALAYEHAVRSTRGGDDPIDSARQPAGGRAGAATWDFSVDTFDEIEAQGLVRDNILAAGAIDYIYELGERMGVFKLIDALALNWVSGSIDVVDGPAVSRMYRYWKLREERPSAEERGMLYRRVLNKGDTEVLSRMVVNEEFPNLWHNLMSEVADYIDKSERVREGASEMSPVSRARIYQVTRDLQYNLTEYCTGMAHIQAREIHAQLQECFEILREPDILAFFGGNRRKSMWTVIEQLSKQEFGHAPNIAAMRSLAVDGNVLFRWVADFSEGSVRQDEFARFLQAAETYILNFSTVGDARDAFSSDEDGEDEEDDFADEHESEDDF
jgi:hypothetical protein